MDVEDFTGDKALHIRILHDLGQLSFAEYTPQSGPIVPASAGDKAFIGTPLGGRQIRLRFLLQVEQDHVHTGWG